MQYVKKPFLFLKNIIIIPLIVSIVIPMILLDLWVEIYHRICFPLYRRPYVKRKKYIKIDRHKLSYLAWYEKIGCAYCGYANGLAPYWVKMAGETEKYWCSIKHQEDDSFIEPEHHKDFAEYNNKEDFFNKYKK
jgi:hypothetical protein